MKCNEYGTFQNLMSFKNRSTTPSPFTVRIAFGAILNYRAGSVVIEFSFFTTKSMLFLAGQLPNAHRYAPADTQSQRPIGINSKTLSF